MASIQIKHIMSLIEPCASNRPPVTRLSWKICIYSFYLVGSTSFLQTYVTNFYGTWLAWIVGKTSLNLSLSKHWQTLLKSVNNVWNSLLMDHVKNKNQRDSNLCRKSRRLACWPLPPRPTFEKQFHSFIQRRNTSVCSSKLEVLQYWPQNHKIKEDRKSQYLFPFLLFPHYYNFLAQ